MFRFISYLVALLWVSLLAAGVIQAHRQPAWANSLAKSTEEGGNAPSLAERIEQGIYKRNAPVIISEGELNRYLNAHLNVSSTGPLAENIAIDRFYVQCQRDGFEVRFLWKAVNGHLAAASARFQVTRNGNQFLIEPTSGSYGRLEVPRGLMAPLLPALQSLAAALKPELDLAFQMNQLRFEPGKIVLDPQFPHPAQ